MNEEYILFAEKMRSFLAALRNAKIVVIGQTTFQVPGPDGKPMRLVVTNNGDRYEFSQGDDWENLPPLEVSDGK